MDVPVHISDLQKIQDVLEYAHDHHLSRDRSNAALHLAGTVRLSPLTSELESAVDRVTMLIATAQEKEEQT